MDAKSKANFINSVASGASVPCPKCGTSNKPDGKFCISCGAEIFGTSVPCPKCGTSNKPDGKFCISCGAKITVPQEAQNSAPAFEPAKEAGAQTKAAKYVEPNNVFAQGLPNWSVEPPQVMVRRH